MKHIVMFSGGAGSWLTARRVAEQHGTDDLILLFADTLMEDDDLYRFLDEAAQNVGGQLVRVAEGRTPWEVFHDVRFLGNTRVDPCSRILKRELLRRWLEDNHDPEQTTVYLGIDWTEEHRFTNAKRHWVPWVAKSPLLDPPYLNKQQMLEHMIEHGIKPPRLYDLGFPHNNCGGFCIKAGQAHFRRLLETMPERYAEHEQKEQEIRDYLEKDVAIMRDRKGGQSRPMTMREFRERVQGQDVQLDMFDLEHDWGGCGCFSPLEDDQP